MVVSSVILIPSTRGLSVLRGRRTQAATGLVERMEAQHATTNEKVEKLQGAVQDMAAQLSTVTQQLHLLVSRLDAGDGGNGSADHVIEGTSKV